ncbi:MAG: FIST N-terminal domain-containing protein, partial [Gaiellaceae bacterium]
MDALGADPGLVLIFPTGTADPADAAGQAQAAAGDAHVVGMTGTGAITADGAIATGCSAIA